MITAVTLNPCNDKAVKVQRFSYGGLNRIIDSRLDGSGKGVNVSVALKRIGCDSACIGILQQDQGHVIIKRLERERVPHAFIRQKGEVRLNQKIIDLSTGFITEVNESGTPISEEIIGKVMDLVRKHARRSEMMVFTGSLPPGAPNELYRRLIQTAQAQGAKCVLDAEGERLALGIDAKPYLIKPNLFELQSLTDESIKTVSEIRQAAISLIKQGISIVGVSMGSEGAFVTDGEQSYYAPPMTVAVHSATGAGDSMVAGMCKGIEAGLPLKELFRLGVAAASASVMAEGSELVSREDYEALLDMVDIQTVEG